MGFDNSMDCQRMCSALRFMHFLRQLGEDMEDEYEAHTLLCLHRRSCMFCLCDGASYLPKSNK